MTPACSPASPTAGRSAQELIAEIGVTMTAFPTAGHLVSRAKFTPIDQQSAEGWSSPTLRRHRGQLARRKEKAVPGLCADRSG
jgi:hypothetical protein